MSIETKKNLEALRDAMRKVHVDAMIIPGTDAHQSEYVSPHWKNRDWVSGFTGSNGTAVVTLDSAALWTDSRYFLQGAQQLENSGFDLCKEDIAGEPTITQWLAQNMEEGSVLAVDGTLFSMKKANDLVEFCGEHGFRFAADFDPFDKIWADRPARPEGLLTIHSEEFAGEGAAEKVEKVLEFIVDKGADSIFISALDEIAWVLNIRSNDVAFLPVAISYLYLSEKKKILFIDECKVNEEVEEYLKSIDVEVKPYDGVIKFLNGLKESEVVMMDPNVVSDTMGRACESDKIYSKSPIALMKSLKNEIQIAGTRAAMERDGAALVKLFMWIEENAPQGNINEMDIWTKGMEFRGEHPYYRGDSFAMIAGYKEHGAIVHYTAKPESASIIKGNGLLLIDSGAQYIDGTTDITRTIAIGTPTQEEIHDYTLVLKGHIAIATQVFPVGTRGSQLDVLARQFMWKEGVSYLHGTGHGVGHFLSVHEGPQNIRLNENPATLQLGMITSDEPGIYRAGKHGIRTENLTLVVPAIKSEEFGEFLKFETLTLFPYDARLIDKSMLSQEEIQWINNYHQEVYDRLSIYLNEEQCAWLKGKTSKI